MRSEQEAIQAIERYADTVRRICMLHLKNHADTEDIFQYYEQYTASEIAALLRRNENTVYTQLKRAKALLRESLGDDADG